MEGHASEEHSRGWGVMGGDLMCGFGDTRGRAEWFSCVSAGVEGGGNCPMSANVPRRPLHRVARSSPTASRGRDAARADIPISSTVSSTSIASGRVPSGRNPRIRLAGHGLRCQRALPAIPHEARKGAVERWLGTGCQILSNLYPMRGNAVVPLRMIRLSTCG